MRRCKKYFLIRISTGGLMASLWHYARIATRILLVSRSENISGRMISIALFQTPRFWSAILRVLSVSPLISAFRLCLREIGKQKEKEEGTCSKFPQKSRQYRKGSSVRSRMVDINPIFDLGPELQPNKLCMSSLVLISKIFLFKKLFTNHEI